MQKFIVLYMAPVASLEEWMKLDPEVRKTDEEKMKKEWGAWMQKYGALFTGGMTAGTGKTKRVTADGVSDVKNEVMLYSIIQAESHEVAAAAFTNHPHFGIPGGWIDVMPINVLPEM
jgi:hypothetical protein